MKRKSKKIKVTSKGTPVVGQIDLQYVQINVPEDMIEAAGEALSHLILSDSYAQKAVGKKSDDYGDF
jgi:hypothetical protein